MSIPHIGLITKVTSLELFLDMVPSSCGDNLTTHVTWMKMRVKAYRLSTWSKFCVTGLRPWITLGIRAIWEMNSLTIHALLTSAVVCNKHSLSFLFTGKELNLEKWTKFSWSPLMHSKRSLKQASGLTIAILQLLINNELKFPHNEIKRKIRTVNLLVR